MNHRRLQETYATDIMFVSAKCFEENNVAQVFAGRKSGMKKVFGLRTESQAHQALNDFIRDIVAPYYIYSDNAKAEMSRVWIKIMRKYNFEGITTEPHYP